MLLGWLTPAHAEDASAADAQEQPTQHDAAPSPGSGAPPALLGPLQLTLFVDAYAAWQTSRSGTLATLSNHRAYSGQGATLRAENGFSLAFLGIDASYDTGRVGVVANLRFGEGAVIYHYHGKPESDLAFGIADLTQAYALWRPSAPLELDLGMFNSPFGAESLDSWRNANYTRSALWTYGEPAWHMGLNAKWQITEALSANALVINGINDISETQQDSGLDQSPTLGASLKFSPSPAYSVAFGGLLALDSRHNDDAGFDTFLDLVAALKLDPMSASFTADYIATRAGAPSGAARHFWGGSLIAGYRFSEICGVAARAEYLQDQANFGGGNVWTLWTGTITIDVEPIAGTPRLILRWDNRWERSNQDVFGRDSRGTADTADDLYTNHWFESVLGVVVTTSS